MIRIRVALAEHPSLQFLRKQVMEIHRPEGLSLLYTLPRQKYGDQRGAPENCQEGKGYDFTNISDPVLIINGYSCAKKSAYAQVGDHRLLESSAVAYQRTLPAGTRSSMAHPFWVYERGACLSP